MHTIPERDRSRLTDVGCMLLSHGVPSSMDTYCGAPAIATIIPDGPKHENLPSQFIRVPNKA